MNVKDLSYPTINSVNPLYLNINKIYEYIEESNGNKYLTLVPTDESKNTPKKYEELWNKIRDLIRSRTNNSHNYDEKYMKIKFDSDIELPLKKTLELHNIIVVRHRLGYQPPSFSPIPLLNLQTVQALFFRQSLLCISVIVTHR